MIFSNIGVDIFDQLPWVCVCVVRGYVGGGLAGGGGGGGGVENVCSNPDFTRAL